MHGATIKLYGTYFLIGNLFSTLSAPLIYTASFGWMTGEM